MITNVWQPGVDILDRVLQHGVATRDAGRWSWEPSVIVGTVILVGAYLYGMGLLRPRGDSTETPDAAKVVTFLAGCLVLFLSLVSPLDALSDAYLFSAHMVQHIMLAVVVPMLWLLGLPRWLLVPLIRPKVIAKVAPVVTFPLAAFLIFNVNFWLWHLPALYDLALADERVHLFQHLTFLSTGVLNWWPVLSPLRELPRLGYARQLLYLFVNCQPNVVLGAILVFSRDVLYRTYLDAPRLFDLSALTDQQLGGLIMWIPGSAIYVVVFSVVFLRWFQGEEQGQPRDYERC